MKQCRLTFRPGIAVKVPATLALQTYDQALRDAGIETRDLSTAYPQQGMRLTVLGPDDWDPNRGDQAELYRAVLKLCGGKVEID